ncbi:Protein CBG20385 [Caenorhabditis briggsae]|uniref:Protein CBG20385 n=1 Tax=Caenorhabditis briggsae TaxID=6238 RepID=A8XXN4_CAEBR|nr:Protein CBG20385 [Caenorhabditis briggsae]CAP37403.1 Protein CBG20385 [Caenorhabditis briggsae]
MQPPRAVMSQARAIAPSAHPEVQLRQVDLEKVLRSFPTTCHQLQKKEVRTLERSSHQEEVEEYYLIYISDVMSLGDIKCIESNQNPASDCEDNNDTSCAHEKSDGSS